MNIVQLMPDRVSVGAPTSGPVANALQFNGAAYCRRNLAMTDNVNSKTLFVSFFFDTGSLADGGTGRIFYANGGRIDIARWSTNQLRIYMYDSSPALLGVLSSSATFTLTANTGWHHCVAWVNTAVPMSEMYIDGIDGTTSGAPTVDGLLNWNRSSFGYAAVDTTGSSAWKGKISNLFIESRADKLASIVSATAADVPGLFRNSDGSVRSYDNESNYPYGDKGERPLGFQPLIYFPGDSSTWEENKGSGGAFVETVSGVTDTAPPL